MCYIIHENDCIGDSEMKQSSRQSRKILFVQEQKIQNKNIGEGLRNSCVKCTWVNALNLKRKTRENCQLVELPVSIFIHKRLQNFHIIDLVKSVGSSKFNFFSRCVDK